MKKLAYRFEYKRQGRVEFVVVIASNAFAAWKYMFTKLDSNNQSNQLESLTNISLISLDAVEEA